VSLPKLIERGDRLRMYGRSATMNLSEIS
jgi:hypothetical protein